MSEENSRKRRIRYPGENPRRFDQKYKELRGDEETVTRVRASGKTPAGSHVPVLLNEVLDVLALKPGERGVDATFGRGGHSRAMLSALGETGEVLALDVDPVEIERSTALLRSEGFGEDRLHVYHGNFAGISKALASIGWATVDFVLADLGVSSMQLDNPKRGFSYKSDGRLDLRMNPMRGISASQWLAEVTAEQLQKVLEDGADEPYAASLAEALAGTELEGTAQLKWAVERCVRLKDAEDAVTRVFQALRIAVNDEFGALESLLRQLPFVLEPGGRAAIITFHSGEDRRVKAAFREGVAQGFYASATRDVLRPNSCEIRDNPRSRSAKLRCAVRAS